VRTPAIKSPQSRGWNGRFMGGLRVNCERAPRLPARCIRWVLDDPRQSPYLLTWRESDDVARTARAEKNPNPPWPELRGLEVILTEVVGGRRAGGDFLRGAWRSLPRGGARDFLLICPECQRPRRHLYGWQVFDSFVSSSRWRCRQCAGLRYASEGGALWYRSRFRLFGFRLPDERWPRPEPWDPELKASEPLYQLLPDTNTFQSRGPETQVARARVPSKGNRNRGRGAPC
jgi:hypothetical protein